MMYTFRKTGTPSATRQSSELGQACLVVDAEPNGAPNRGQGCRGSPSHCANKSGQSDRAFTRGVLCVDCVLVVGVLVLACFQ